MPSETKELIGTTRRRSPRWINWLELPNNKFIYKFQVFDAPDEVYDAWIACDLLTIRYIRKNPAAVRNSVEHYESNAAHFHRLFIESHGPHSNCPMGVIDRIKLGQQILRREFKD